jgi:serine/threonine protein kinase
MTSLLCPRCREPCTGPALPSGWLSCRRCNHRWLPTPEQVSVPEVGAEQQPDVVLPTMPPSATSAPPALPVLSAPPAPVVAPEANVPAPAAVAAPVALAAAAALSDASGANKSVAGGRVRQDTNEYPPDETSELRQRTKALTSRRDASPPAGLAPMIAARVAADKVSPPPAPAIASPGAPPVPPASRPARGADAAAGDPFDPDLFDRMERDAQQQRAKQHTVAEIPVETAPPPAVAARQVTCPVCGHGFLTAKADADQQVCPQCHTSFNIAKGHVVSGGPRQGNDDPLLGRALRGCLIDRKIGEGGMGSVYHARQLSLDRSVAVKVLPPELARNRNFISRFEREAKSLAKINHPNILHIYDFGEEPQLSVYFMIIEFVEGKDLGEILHEQYSMGQVEVLDIVRQAALGLEMAAEKGVIHRDIKPDNLMLTAEGVCKVSDFGLAKGHGAERDVTNVGVRVGTPAFMSPEQCDGVDVDFRSDIYNLGCTAFLALTGSLPFDADTPFAIMLKHKNDPVPTLKSFNPNIHPRVDSLVQRMIAKRPADRFATLRELIDLVEELEVELAGTTNVLRKSRGPFRIMSDLEAVEHARMTSKGQRDEPAALSLRERPSPPARPALPAPPAQPAGRVPTSPPVAGESALPDWLKPVDQPPVKRPPSSLTGAPLAPATPPPATSSSSGSGLRDLRVKLAEARNRNLQEEAGSIAATADRLAAAGQHEEAAAAWQRASVLSPNMRESQELQARALRARHRGGRKRTIRTMANMLLLLALVGVGLWQGTPPLHNYLAECQLEPIEIVIDANVRLRELDLFIAEYGQPYPWYSALFQRTYEITAVQRARRAGELIRHQIAVPPAAPPPQAPLPPRAKEPVPVQQPLDPALARLESAFGDATVSWEQLAKEAAAIGAVDGPAGERARAILAEAKKQLQGQEADSVPIHAAWAAGHQGQVLELLARFRLAHARAGDWLPVLLPARLEVVDADSGHQLSEVHVAMRVALPPGGAAIVSSPATLAAGERRFCRLPSAETLLEISAPGYRQESLRVGANPDEQEQQYQVVLHPSQIWSRQLGAGLSWVRIAEADERTVLVRNDDSISTLRLADGMVESTLSHSGLPAHAPGAGAPSRWTPSWSPTPQGVITGTSDGLAVLLTLSGHGFSLGEILYRGRSPVLAVAEHELTFQAGKRAIYIVEGVVGAMQLIARTSERDLWSHSGLSGRNEPQLWFHDDRVVVLDDQRLQELDETDGHQLSVASLSARRAGPGVLIDKGAYIAVPTVSGIDLVRVASATSNKLEIFHDPALDLADGRQLCAADGQLLVARADHGLRLLGWKDGKGEMLWSQALATEGGAISSLALSGDHALISDEAGVIYLCSRATGALQRRFVSPTPLLGPPLEMRGALIAADRNGAITAYALPPLP